MVAFLRGNLMENLGYLYLHDDNLSEVYAKAKSHYFWRFIRDKTNWVYSVGPSAISNSGPVDKSDSPPRENQLPK